MNSKRKKGHVHQQITKAFQSMVQEHCERTGDCDYDVAELLGISPTYLSNLTCGVHPVPADILALATRKLDSEPHGAQTLCRLCFGSFRPNPEVPETSTDILALTRGCIEDMQTCTRWLNTVSEAVVDGKVSISELTDCRRDFDRMQVRSNQTMALIEALSDQQPSNGRCAKLVETARAAS